MPHKDTAGRTPSRTGLALLAIALLEAGCGQSTPKGPPAIGDLTVEAGIHRARFHFRTSFAARVTVDVTPPEDQTRVEDSSGEATHHEGVVLNLSPSHRYTLQVSQGSKVLEEHPFLTRSLTVDDVHQEIQGDRIRFMWTTSAPARCSVIWRASGLETQSLEESGPERTGHAVEISGLEHDHSYDATVVAHLADGEEETAGPYRIGHVRGLAEDFIVACRAASLDARMQDYFAHARANDPQRASREGKLIQAADTLRRPLGVLRPYLPQVLSGSLAVRDLQVRVYDALCRLAHLERLAVVIGLPLIPILQSGGGGGIGGAQPGKPGDMGPFYQVPHAGLVEGPSLHVTVQQKAFPGEGVNLREWHPGTEEPNLFLLHRNPPKREAQLTFNLPDPLRILRAEVGIATRRFYPLQYLEITVNSKIDLVLRPPPTNPPFYQWNIDYLGLDPAILKPGLNTFRLRLRAIPGADQLKNGYVKWVELRVVPAPAP